jgi:hypothetical protein
MHSKCRLVAKASGEYLDFLAPVPDFQLAVHVPNDRTPNRGGD